ncbi:MAG: QueT transporter family protein [Candidatus Bathyarchaeota archaeon]|nr:MAG: QueT transporter family protein [Candidatus Bathyarchaeota archaeon]
MDARDVSLAAVFASLYAVINIIQTAAGGPITYGPVQLRLADCLIPLAALFGWPHIFGVSLGCLSNAYYWLDPADVVVGPIVNFVAAALIFYLRKHKLTASGLGSLTVGVPIGLYLYFLYTQGNPIITQQVPSFQGLSLPVWFAFVASLTISSVVAVGIMGYILLSTIGRSAIVEPLKSRGLRIYQREG